MSIGKRKLILYPAISFFVLIVIIGYINFDKISAYYSYGNSYNLKMNLSNFTFTIPERNILDGDKIQSNGTVFNLLKAKEKEKLIVFLNRNNLKVKPGNYILNYNEKFEDIADKLYFVK